LITSIAQRLQGTGAEREQIVKVSVERVTEGSFRAAISNGRETTKEKAGFENWSRFNWKKPGTAELGQS